MGQPLGVKCWLILGGIVLVLSIALGVMLKKQANSIALEALLYQEIDKARAAVHQARASAKGHRDRADELALQVKDLELRVHESRAAAAAIPKKPKTLGECMAGLDTLRNYTGLIEEQLAFTAEEVLELRDVLTLKEHEITQLEAIIDLEHKRAESATRRAKRERRIRITTMVLGGSVMLAAGYGIGKVAP